MRHWPIVFAALAILGAGIVEHVRPQGFGLGWSYASTTDQLELQPGTIQPGSTSQATVASNTAAISSYQIGGPSGTGPSQGPYAETWPPIASAQEGNSSSPFHSAVGSAEWVNPSFDLYDGSFNSHDQWWNSAEGYENVCVIGGNDSGALLNNNHFYGVTSVDFYADGSNTTGPSKAITATSAIGNPNPYTITGGTVAGSTLAALTINPTFPFSPSEKIHISGATGSSAAYNGDWTVAPPDPNGVYGQKVGTLTMSTTNGLNTIPPGTPAPTGAKVVSTEPLYWCAHAYPKDYPDGFHEFRAVVHYLNGFSSTLETARKIDALDTSDNEGIMTMHGGIGFSAAGSQISFLPQTNFGASNTYDCLVPGYSYTPAQPPSGSNFYWGNMNPAYHWLGDERLQILVNGSFTATSGTISSNGSVAQFSVPHTIVANAAPYLTNGSTVNTAFTIPSQTYSSVTPAGTTATFGGASAAITVHNGDQVTVSGLTNPTYTVGSISVTGTTATATLFGTGSSDILAPTTTVAGESVTVTITGSSIGTVTGVTVTGASAGVVQFHTTASAGSYTGGTLSLVSGGGWNQRFYTTTNSSGAPKIQFPDGESYSVSPTGTATILWAQDQKYRIASYSYQATTTFGANQTITVSPAGGNNITYVPGQVVYVTGLPSIAINSPAKSAQYTLPLNGNFVGGTSGVFVTVVAGNGANSFTTYNPSISDYSGYTISSISMSGTTETVNFTVPGVATAPIIPIGSTVNVLNPLTSSAGTTQNQLAAVSVTVTASSVGQIKFTNASGAGTAGWGILQILTGTFANSSSGTIAVAVPNPNQIVTSDLSVAWVQANNAAVGTPDYPHLGVQLSSMTITSGVATAQYPTNIVTPTGLTISGTGSVKLVSFQHSVKNVSGVCTDSNIIVAGLTDGVNTPMPYQGGGGSDTMQQWQSLWASTNFNGSMYEPTVVVDNHQDSGDANPNHFNITAETDNGNGTATATFTGNVAIPVGSSIIVSNTISADPNDDGFNTLWAGPQAITAVSYNTACGGTPTVTLTYSGAVNVFPTTSAVWVQVQGATNSGGGSAYTGAWNGRFIACAASVGSVSYNVLTPISGTPAWTGSTTVATPTTGVYPDVVTASSAGSPTSTVTYQMDGTAATTSYLSGGTIDIADCGQDGTNANACTTIDGALTGLHKTGQNGALGSNIGMGFTMTLTSPGSITNAETFSTTYAVSGTWTVSGSICTIKMTIPGGYTLPFGGQVDASLNTTSTPLVLTNAYVETSTNVGVNTSQITVPCTTGATPASGGTVQWHSEFRVGMPLYHRSNGAYTPSNISNGVYPNQPFFVEASTGPGSSGGTLIPAGGKFLLAQIPNGPPLQESSLTGSTLYAMNQEEDLATVCLTGPTGSSATPSSAQYYTLGNASFSNVSYFNNIGWTRFTPCSGSNPHSVVGTPSGEFGTGTSFFKWDTFDFCAHTSLNSLAYCSTNDASIYGNTETTNGASDGKYAAWFNNINLFGYSGYLAPGGPGTTWGTGSNVGVAKYVTNQYTINNYTPFSIPDIGYSGSAVEGLEFINQTGQLANWSLYDHAYFDGMPGSGYQNIIGCANSGAPGWPNISGCSNPQGTLATGIWTGGVGSGVRNPYGTCSSGGCDPANTYSCNTTGALYGCNIVPMAQIQRDVQSLQANTNTSQVPTSWTHAGGGPFPSNSTFAMALNIQSGSNPANVSWEIGGPTNKAIILTDSVTPANVGKVFSYIWASGSTTVDTCSENQQCISACFDATLANPSCPEGQAQFVSAGCDVRPGGTYDPTHSTSCVQMNNINTLTAPNVVNKVALTCSLFGTNGAAPALCNATGNPTATWEEVYPQTASGALTTLIGVWNGAHLDIVFNKINSFSWGDELFNELDAPLSDPSCRINGLQPYPIVCNAAVGLAFEELAYSGPVVFLNSAGWDKNAGGPGFGADNKYFKNNQLEDEAGGGGFWSDPLEVQRLTVDTINPLPASGRLWDNSTCWNGPSGQTHGGVPIGVGYYVHPMQQNGYAYTEMYPTTSISVTGTTATVTFTGLPFTPLIPPGSLVHIKGLTGGLVNANTDSNSNHINAQGNFYTLTTVGSVAGTIQFPVPSGMNGLSQSTGVVLDWPDGLYWNSPAYSTVYTITGITLAGTVETVTYTSPDGLPIATGSPVTIAGVTPSDLNVTGLASGSVGSFTITNATAVGPYSSGGTATFSQACQW